MFFIPGGRFEQGDGDSALYNGASLVQHGVIYININYRLGALGFLVADGLTGNYGIRDQQLALTWVQQNIRAFGGDPSNVLLYGQSAGGSSTAVHLVAPSSFPLYAKAIIHSDPGALPIQSPQVASNIGNRFVADLGCSSQACLLNASVDAILAAQSKAQNHINFPSHLLDIFMPFVPVVDGDLIPEAPITAFPAGRLNPVPVMMGTVLAEAWLFIYQADTTHPVDKTEYLAILTAVFNREVVRVYEHYPATNSSDTRPDLALLGTQYLFTCPTRLAARAFANTTAWLYQFTHVLSFDAWGPDYPYCVGVVCHGSELPILYNSTEPYFNMTPGELALSAQMQLYWTNFAKSSNPNKPVAPELQWPQWEEAQQESLQLATPPSLSAALDQANCDFWDQLGYTWGT